MGDEQPKASGAAKDPSPTQSSAPESPKEKRFSREELAADASGLLNTSPHMIAGALANESKQTFTLEEAEKLVKSFTGRAEEVDNEPEREDEA